MLISKGTNGENHFEREMDQTLQTLTDENQRQRACIEKMEQELKCLPEGSLCFKIIADKSRPYHQICIGGRRTQKSIAGQLELLEALVRKQIICRNLADLHNNVEALSACIEQYHPLHPGTAINKLPEHCQEVRQRCYTLLGKPDIDSWLTEPFPQNPYRAERRIHPTLRGELVRSKSEMNLANLLFAAGVPYRYEALLLLCGKDYYPDFTILHLLTGKLYYWEHFGMTGDREYMIKADSKIALYREQGIVQWQNLIVTYDTPDGIFDVQTAQRIIRAFFM